MLTPENQAALRHALCDCRREALSRFVAEFMVTLSMEGFSFVDLLGALADWTYGQSELEQVVIRLEEACIEAQRVHKQQN